MGGETGYNPISPEKRHNGKNEQLLKTGKAGNFGPLHPQFNYRAFSTIDALTHIQASGLLDTGNVRSYLTKKAMRIETAIVPMMRMNGFEPLPQIKQCVPLFPQGMICALPN